METNPRLDRLRQQAGDLAENMGTQWADYVAAVINQWTDGEEQGLLDRGAELFEMLCRDHVQTFRNDAQEDGWAAPEQDIAILDETAHAAFHKRIGEAVLPSAGTSGRAKQTLAQSRTHGAESLHIHHDAVSVPRKQHGILVPSKERDVPHEQNRVIRTLPVGHSRSPRVSGR